MVWLCSLVLAGEGDAPYLRALAAWDRGEWGTALAEAEAALAAEPGHRPARLLEGYALFRLDRPEDGVGVLQALAAEPVSTEYDGVIQRRADRLWHRWADRARRDQVAVSGGFVLPVEKRYDTILPNVGLTAEVEVPVPGPVAVRAEVLLPVQPEGLFDVGGDYIGLEAVLHHPLGRGVWAVDAALGPELWLARGGYWSDGNQPYLGLRAAAGLDVRPARRVGFRLQAGTRWVPGALEDLPWYAVPFDLSLTTVSWWGP